jgi:hypothetical protein
VAACRSAIVSVVIGDAHQRRWRRHVQTGWLVYAQRFGLQLIVFEDYLDTGPRARSRSPAWQKLLVLEHPAVAHCDRVVWLDADVAVNSQAPLVFEGVPELRVGGVLNNAFISHPVLSASFGRTCDPEGPAAHARAMYERCGLSPAWDHVVNTGVLVASPRHHAALFRRVYEEGSEVPGSYSEQTALSHRLLTEDVFHLLDARFNVLWYEFVDSVYDFLAPDEPLRARALASLFQKSFFLHFAAEQDDLPLLDAEAARSPWPRISR